MRAEGYTVSLLHGKDMPPAERDVSVVAYKDKPARKRKNREGVCDGAEGRRLRVSPLSVRLSVLCCCLLSSVMSDFRSNKTSVLITTNVLARGIDVLSVTLVINYDVPTTRHGKPDSETYIHRIGRSGRFGRKGVAINFVHDDTSRAQLGAIAAHFQKPIVKLPRDNLELVSEVVQKDLK